MKKMKTLENLTNTIRFPFSDFLARVLHSARASFLFRCRSRASRFARTHLRIGRASNALSLFFLSPKKAMLRFTSAAATARRLPCIAGRASVSSSPVSRPSATSLRYRQNDVLSLRTFASSSDANEGTNGGAESPTLSSSPEQPSATTPSLSRESRQSETQAINLRAIKQSDQIGAAAEQLKKRLGGKEKGVEFVDG